MRPWKPLAVAVILSASTVVGPALSPARAGDRLIDLAGDRIGIRLKRFLVGYLEPNTDRFVALNGRGADDCFRDAVLMFEFTGPIDLTRVGPVDYFETITDEFGNVFPNPGYDLNPAFVHLNSETIRIGTAAGPGLFIPAEGSFNEYTVRQFNPVSGSYDPKRTYRDRILFDPTKRLDGVRDRNPDGFDANTEYTIILPGVDSGADRTVRSRSGRPLLRTFETTVRTQDAYQFDYFQPSVVSVEATDLPGAPLDGRSDVPADAGIVATFSEPMSESTFIVGSTFLVRETDSGLDVPGTIAFSPDRRQCLFLPSDGFGPDPIEIEVTVKQGLTDRVGYSLSQEVKARFTTGP